MKLIRITLLIIVSSFLLINEPSCALTAEEKALIHELTRQGATQSYIDAWTLHFCEVESIREAGINRKENE